MYNNQRMTLWHKTQWTLSTLDATRNTLSYCLITSALLQLCVLKQQHKSKAGIKFSAELSHAGFTAYPLSLTSHYFVSALKEQKSYGMRTLRPHTLTSFTWHVNAELSYTLHNSLCATWQRLLSPPPSYREIITSTHKQNEWSQS